MREGLGALTTRGRAFLASGVTTIVCAIVLGQGDLVRVGVLLAALPLVTVAMVARARYHLVCTRSVHPARVPTGSSSTVRLRLQNAGRVPTGVLMLEDQVPYVLGSRPRFLLDQMGSHWHNEVSYTVHSDVRGRYQIGPLNIRVSDPFRLIELTRSFQTTTALTVTPATHRLGSSGLSGEWSGTGENRPRAFAAAGTEDVTIREYREGDDLRRVHWPSSARTGELMVRREEQPWQSRCTLLLDTRKSAHRGSGPASSFEWGVSATASIGVHLAQRGFNLRLATDKAGSKEASVWHDSGAGVSGETDVLLDQLAVARASDSRILDLADTSEHGQPEMVVAVLGLLEPEDVAALTRLRGRNGAALAILLDASLWTHERSYTAETTRRTRGAASALQHQGWHVTVASPTTKIATAWKLVTLPTKVRSAGLLPYASETELETTGNGGAARARGEQSPVLTETGNTP
jgi:uncharacterized protein (DUF58 family)